MSQLLSSKNNIEWIDKAKGFAILGVVAVHTVQRFSITGTIAKIASAGMYGVSLFFIVSSYLTFLSFDKEEQKWNVSAYLKYLFHKIIRLVPILYIAIVWNLVQYFISVEGIPDKNDGVWYDALFAATFTNAFSFNHFNPWCNWYLGTLVIFLALAPAIHKWINTPIRSVLFFLATMIFVWLLDLLIYRQSVLYYSFYYYCSLPKQFPVIALGIVFYQLRKNKTLIDNSKSLSLLAIVISLSLLMTLCTSIEIMEFHVIMGVLLLTLAYSAFNNTNKIFDWLKPLGKYSYGIYLFHWCLLKIFSVISHRIGIDTSSSIIFLLYYIFLVLLSLICAFIATHYIERPFFKYLKRKSWL